MDILKALPQYAYIGVGRDDGKEKGEYSAILYRKDRFKVKWQGTLWLSETPQTPGSKSWDAAITRVLTRASFIDDKANKEFLYYNTHFDHIGKEARKKSSILIKRTILMERPHVSDSPLMPVIVSGDFNSPPLEEAYQQLATSNMIFDSRPANSTQGTFCNFKVNSQECNLIDYIFHSKEVHVKNYQVITDNDGTYYPSDHLPVMVEFTFD